jgi:hypothetical protein
MGGLSLSTPIGLGLLGLLVPLVVLYVLKVKRRVVRVPSTWLWQVAQRDHLASSPLKKLLAQLPLILQALALVLLALALARPVSRSKTLSGQTYAVVLDESASMLAELGDDPTPRRTRFDAAKDAAIAFIERLPPGAEVLVVEAAREARIASALERDVPRLAAAIQGLSAEEVEGDLTGAVGVAVDRLKAYAGAKIVVFTDGNLAREVALEGVEVPIDVVKVGDPVDNVAIVRVDATTARARAGVGAKSDVTQVFTVVANYGSTDREVFVTLREENASDVLDSRKLVVHAGEKAPVVLGFDTAPGDFGEGLIVDVSPHDRMPVDDVAYARVPEGARQPVVLASAGSSPWLERALSTDDGVELRKVELGALATLALPRSALVVVDGACPPEDAPGGDLLVIHPKPGKCLGVEVGPEVASPTITSWANGDPRLRFLTLDGVIVAHANPLVVSSTKLELVRGREGVLAADASTLSRPATLVGFDVGDSDWPLKASFVLFIRNIVEQASEHRARGLLPAAHTGEPLRIAVPPGVARVEIKPPYDAASFVRAENSLAVVPSVARAGLYRVSYEGPSAGTSHVPVNLASSAESDLRRTFSPSKSAAVEVRDAKDPPPAFREHAWWIALVVLAFALFDLWYYTRGARASRLSLAPRAPARGGT